MSTNDSIEIYKLQRNLSSLRKLAGWTAGDLAQKVGVTKQTISNLETGRTTMNKMQYIALRSILDYEARSNQNLAKALHLVLDDHESTLEEHKAHEDLVKTVAAATTAGVASATLSMLLGAATITLGAWLATIMDKDD